MRVGTLKQIIAAVGVYALLFTTPSNAQNVRVEARKSLTTIPKRCESVVPASLEDKLDIAGLLKESMCKGAGTMMADYTYMMHSSSREKDKKGKVKEESATYEVFIPTLKAGLKTRGILLITSRNGVSVPADELDKERVRAGERLQNEENRISRQNVPPANPQSEVMAGMLPIGMYPQIRVHRSTFGVKRSDAALGMLSILDKSVLTFLRHEAINERDALVFSFVARPDVQLNDNEKYVARLHGTIWIDAKDRIVEHLTGWPSEISGAAAVTETVLPEKPPAVDIEMTLLPEGVWLPRLVRLNGADYPTLFAGVVQDTTLTYSQYKRFTTEISHVESGGVAVP